MTTVDGMFIWRLYGGGDDWGDSVDQYRWWKLPGQHLHRSVKLFSQIIRTHKYFFKFCSKSVNTKYFLIQIHKMHIIVFRLNVV